jgi:ribonuclease HI
MTIRQKGSIKRAGKPNFWGKYAKNVPKELIEMVYSQYYSHDTLSVYCDGSSKGELMAVACSYVQNTLITVRQKLVYPPKACIGKNFYSELKAITFGLNHFEKYRQDGCRQVILYSDVAQIEEFLEYESTFRKSRELRESQVEMIQTYHQKKEHSHIPITIKYLPVDQKKHNPLARSSHNGAKKLLRR